MDQDAFTIEATEFITRNTLLITLISAVLSFIVFILIWNKERKDLTSKTKKFTPLNIISVILFGMALNILLTVILGITGLYKYFPSYDAVNEALKSGSFIIRFITLGIAAPVVEELCFRGLVFNRLKNGNMPVVLAMILSSLAFGIIHLNLLQGMYAFVLGMAIVIIYNKFKTIWAPILIHMSFNMISVFMSDMENVNDGLAIILTIASIIVIGAFSFMLFKKEKAVEVPGNTDY